MSFVPFTFPISKAQAEAYARQWEPDACEIRFQGCSHVEFHGGTIADPACEMARVGKTLQYKTVSGRCFSCENPNWGNKLKTDLSTVN
jgi:hypothetical protein